MFKWLINFLKRLFGMEDATTTNTTTPAAQVQSDQVTTGPLTVDEYSRSFFTNRLRDIPVATYKLPAGAKGYGPNGNYSAYKFDPSVYNADRKQLVYSNANSYVDIEGLRIHHPDGTTTAVVPTQMRAWLYALSIDPSSVTNDILGLGSSFLESPRNHVPNVPIYGSFGG